MTRPKTLTWQVGHISPPKDGKAWSFGGTRTTTQTNTEHIKSLRGWGGRDGLELAIECTRLWREKGHSGYPSGPASFFHEALPKRTLPYANWTVNGTLTPHFHGGWVECYSRGHVDGPLRYYDLNSAYAWSAGQGLPTGRLRPWSRGDERYVGIMDIRLCDPSAPSYYRSGRTALVTHEDVSAYDLSGDLRWAVTWDEESNGVARTLERVGRELPPGARKGLMHSYWGRWAMSERCTCEVWRGGELAKSWKLPSRELNLVLAAVIVHRVIRRVWKEARKGCHLVQVDAILTGRKLETGDAPGDWKLAHEVGPAGAWIVGPGRWAEVPVDVNPSRWIKHAGLQVDGDAILDPDTLAILAEEKLLQESFDGWELIVERERMRRERLGFDRPTEIPRPGMAERLEDFDSAIGFFG